MTRVKTWFTEKIKYMFFSSDGLPIFLSLVVISLLFVLFRMKSVELDYRLTEIDGKTKTISSENKELKARRARMLSVKNLRTMANKHNLSEPGQSQIIVISN